MDVGVPLPQQILQGTEKSDVKRNFIINSPLEKGDTGGCEAEREEGSQKQPPSPPLLRGNISGIFRYCFCPAIHMGNGQTQGEGVRGRAEVLRYNKIVFSAVAVLMISLAVITFQRNKVWHTKVALWEDVVKKSPMKSRPHNNLGNCYMLLGDHHKAVEEYKKAIALDKDNIEAYYNLGMNLEKTGRSDEAVFYYDIFIRNAPAVYEEQKQAVLEHIKEIRQDK